MNSGKTILIGVSGSIAAYKACDVIRRLMEKGHTVKVAMSEEAGRFVTATTFAALTANPVYETLWGDNGWRMDHIAWAKQAHAMAIVPATANMIAKCAYGFADDCVSALYLTVSVPVLVAPAMNTEMFHKPIVKANISRLVDNGTKIIMPTSGRLACGDVGQGHLADVDVIVDEIESVLK